MPLLRLQRNCPQCNQNDNGNDNIKDIIKISMRIDSKHTLQKHYHSKSGNSSTSIDHNIMMIHKMKQNKRCILPPTFIRNTSAGSAA